MKKIFDIKKMGALALGLVAFAPAASAQDEVETTIAADVVNQYILAWSVTGRSLFAANTLVLATRACLIDRLG